MGEHPRFWIAFGIMLLAFAFFTVMSVYIVTTAHAETELGPSAPPVVHITDDPGGNVAAYYRKYQALSNAGTEIHFHGICASACTMVLFKEFTGIRACADEGAIFAFHKPFTQNNGKIARSKSAKRETRKLWAMWLAALPDPLRKYLQGVHVPSATDGDEQNTLLLLPAGVLLPKCSVTVAAQ
ncbi:hypothetical protein [Mesorhizobium sp. ESP-6-2]|uniref:hypothetical protein n=1 Tax=Mesorhizobium sp. ESP-6-2 TaxID=2876625 RepID=UPI001CCF6AA9|nr:hypothetical protein [Mesorhizobium sp. ESP-6-2]MBZ9807711.1 hypothetical protein [Mesorhizobium sp. ESP-6-2]